MQALVLAAGKGTRMRSDFPKVLHGILGRPLAGYVLEILEELGITSPKVVIGSGAAQVRSFIEAGGKGRRNPVFILQREQKGTGHAVEMARKYFPGTQEEILIWPGDMPFLKRQTVREFIKRHKESGAEASALSSLQTDPAGYGRILRAGGRFYAIREELDASAAEKKIQEVNSGIYLFKTKPLFDALKKIRPANRKKEFYLTDTIEILSKEGRRLEAFALASEEEARGINSRQDLAAGIQIMKKREVEYHEERGVTFVAPDQTFVEPDVKIGRDTVIYPWCYIEAGVKIGKRCKIGPFAKIRRGTKIGDEAVIGSFVEVSRSRIGSKVLVKHLAYLGDAVVGEGTNIGAGAVTANFDGKNKHVTQIGKKVLIGSNTVLIAPVAVADRARTGAGSVVPRGTKIKKGQVVAGVPARPLAKNKTG